MELFFPLLLLLGIVLFGWFAGLYLLYHFAASIKNKTPRSRWSAALGIGWLCTFLGLFLYLISPNGISLDAYQAGRMMRSLGSAAYAIGIIAWIYGFFQHRAVRLAQKRSSTVAFQQGTDTWPPPPTV